MYQRGLLRRSHGGATPTSCTPPGLTDTASQLPPSAGTYAYGTFKPGAAGFPSVGGTYTDPIFGATVLRLTAIGVAANNDQIYSRNGYHNADGTMCMTWSPTGGGLVTLIDSRTGAVLYGGMPTGTATSGAVSFDPVDPNVYYYPSTATMRKVTLTGGGGFTDTPLKTFAFTLGNLGVSVDFIDNTGTYWLIHDATNTLVYVWKKTTDELYSNPITPLGGGGWTGITPSGNYVVDLVGASAYPNKERRSYAINHGTKSISTTPVQFCGLGGSNDHGDLLSASDGHEYFIAPNDDLTPLGLYRWDITTDNSGKTDTQQLASATRIMPITSFDDSTGHVSCVSKGAYRDYAIFSVETALDVFDYDPATGWSAYRQEILFSNVLTLVTYRLLHHRSRSIGVNYGYQPKVCIAWGGQVAIWDSDYNTSSPAGYADLYGWRNSCVA